MFSRQRRSMRDEVTRGLLGVACMLLSACQSKVTTSDASASTHDRVFVSQAGSSTLLVVDATSGKTAGRIEVGMLPHNIVVSPDGRTLYTALVGSQAIAEIDVGTLSLRRTLLTAPVPERRADGTVIQPHFDEGAFSASSCFGCHFPGGAEPKYAGDRPFGLLLSPDGRRLYVTHLRASRLTVLDLDAGQIESTISLMPAGAATEVVAIDRLGDEIWVALRAPQPSTEPGALRRLNATTLEPIADLPAGADSGALLALPERESILVSNFASNTVTMHGAESDGSSAPFDFVASPGPLGLLRLDDSRALSLDYYSNAVSFLDLEAKTAQTLALEHEGLPYANPTNAALASNGRSAWLVSSGTDGHLLELDLASKAVVRDVGIDGLSFGVAVVPEVSP
ncbi:MAG TPA: YncE family protein [Polyangiaceae bacterium]|nr:YncE family protein [Polyangiaceae bacterium]